MAKPLGIFKKVDLSNLSEGWGDETYMKFKPMTIQHLQQMQSESGKVDIKQVEKGKVDQKTLETVDSVLAVLQDMFHSGKVYDENMELMDAEKEHVSTIYMQDPERFMDALFGSANDPKS